METKAQLTANTSDLGLTEDTTVLTLCMTANSKRPSAKPPRNATDANPANKMVQLSRILQRKMLVPHERTRSSQLGISPKQAILLLTLRELKQKTALKAQLMKLSALSEASRKIDDLVSSGATSEADLKAATAIRKKEHADFDASEKKLMEIIFTSQHHRAEVHASKSILPTHPSSRLGDQHDVDGVGAPAAAVYQRHCRDVGGREVEGRGRARRGSPDREDCTRQTEKTAHQNFELLENSFEDEIR